MLYAILCLSSEVGGGDNPMDTIEDKNQKIWKGKVFDFTVEQTVLPNGRETTIDVVRHPGSAAIVPIQEDRSVVLLWQYRPVVQTFLWEIPAGTMHRGEEPLDCAKRELEEECGLLASRFDKIGEILTAPGYSDEQIHLFLARDLSATTQKLDEDEYLQIHSFRFEDALELIKKGEIKDAMTIVGLKVAYARLK